MISYMIRAITDGPSAFMIKEIYENPFLSTIPERPQTADSPSGIADFCKFPAGIELEAFFVGITPISIAGADFFDFFFGDGIGLLSEEAKELPFKGFKDFS